MNDLQTLFFCCVAFAVLAVVSLVMWAGAKRRNMQLISLLERTQKNADSLKETGQRAFDEWAKCRAENAALRSQISQRDASGRFAKKNAS